MFPVAETSLSLLDISDYWSRVIVPPASRKALLRLLEGAWWLGEIKGDSSISRLEFLKRMFTSMRDRDDLGIVFTDGESACGTPPRELSDGGFIVHVRHLIRLPSVDLDSWTEASCMEAFHALAQTSSSESYPELVPGLAFIELTHDEFDRWLEKRRYSKPDFWKPRGRLEIAKRGRPSEYNWDGVKNSLRDYVSQHGPITTQVELLQKCADFARDLHRKKHTPDDNTIRAAIRRYALDMAAGFAPGK